MSNRKLVKCPRCKGSGISPVYPEKKLTCSLCEGSGLTGILTVEWYLKDYPCKEEDLKK